MNSSSSLQGEPMSNNSAQTTSIANPINTEQIGGQLPAATLNQLQQQVDTQSGKAVSSNDIWLAIAIGASVIFVLAAVVVGVGIGMRKRASTTS